MAIRKLLLLVAALAAAFCLRAVPAGEMGSPSGPVAVEQAKALRHSYEERHRQVEEELNKTE